MVLQKLRRRLRSVHLLERTHRRSRPFTLSCVKHGRSPAPKGVSSKRIRRRFVQCLSPRNGRSSSITIKTRWKRGTGGGRSDICLFLLFTCRTLESRGFYVFETNRTGLARSGTKKKVDLLCKPKWPLTERKNLTLVDSASQQRKLGTFFFVCVQVTIPSHSDAYLFQQGH